MSSNSNDILNKVAALLEKTTDRGCTPQEAEAAAALAQKLLLRYNLTMEQVTAANTEERAISFFQVPKHSTRRFDWEIELARVLAQHLLCRLLLNKQGYIFVGTAHDICVAIGMFARLRPVIMQMGVNATHKYGEWWADRGVSPRDLKGKHSLRSYKLSYLRGVVNGVEVKLIEQREQAEAVTSGVTAMVVRRDLAINDAVNKRFPNLKNRRASDQNTNEYAIVYGLHDGLQLSIARGDITTMANGKNEVHIVDEPRNRTVTHDDEGTYIYIPLTAEERAVIGNFDHARYANPCWRITLRRSIDTIDLRLKG